MKQLAFTILGGVITFFIIDFIGKSKSKKSVANDHTKQDFINLLKTEEANDLIMSNKFKQLLLTNEFRQLMKGIADDYLISLTKAL